MSVELAVSSVNGQTLVKCINSKRQQRKLQQTAALKTLKNSQEKNSTNVYFKSSFRS